MPTQLEVLDRHFAQGGTLTVAEALHLFGVYALSQRCGELRKMQRPLVADTVTTETGKRVKRYRYEPRP